MPEYRFMIGESRRCYTYLTIEAETDEAAVEQAKKAYLDYKPQRIPDTVTDEADGDVTITVDRMDGGKLDEEIAYLQFARERPYSWEAIPLAELCRDLWAFIENGATPSFESAEFFKLRARYRLLQSNETFVPEPEEATHG